MKPLKRGSVIGILGGGQLGRMLAIAAAERFGYQCNICDVAPNSPAMQVAARSVVPKDFLDTTALLHFAQDVDVVTCEFENVPVEALQYLEKYRPVYPSSQVFAIAQHREKEKKFLNAIGIPTAPWAVARNIKDVADFCHQYGQRAVVKTMRGGYDGKGQMWLNGDNALSAMEDFFQQRTAIIEAQVEFTKEISVIVARGMFGEIVAYPVVENVHENGILKCTVVPAEISGVTSLDAMEKAIAIAYALDVVGLVAVEMFVTREDKIVVNEIAPRPHNSGHWTLDACNTSQFEQCIRAIAGHPLGNVERRYDAVMLNLLGQDIAKAKELRGYPHMRVYDYGKIEVRDGRKMGHATELFPIRQRIHP